MESPGKDITVSALDDDRNSKIVDYPQVLEFMANRRSVPAKFMSGPGPNDKQLAKILEIACRVPDHGKITPWRLIRYNHEKCVDLGEKILVRAINRHAQEGRGLSDEKIEIERNRFLRAPVVIAVISCATKHHKISKWEQILSSGAVAMNLLIGANASGYDAQWLTEWCAYDEELHSEFGLKGDERITAFVHMGTRSFPKTQRERPNIDDLYSVIGI